MKTGHNRNMNISATEFKAKCLELMDTVNRTGEVLQITKRGKIVAELRRPEAEKPKYSGPGFARETLRIYDDIIAPTGVEWDALKNGD